MNKDRYVLGFVFDRHDNVLLVQKTKPQFQAGFYNGIGGKIETHDLSDADAMRREFREETGHYTAIESWIYITTFQSAGWEVVVFTYDHRLDNMDGWDGAPTDTDEILRVVNLREIFGNSKLLINLPWLIGMCLDTNIHAGHYQITNKEPV